MARAIMVGEDYGVVLRCGGGSRAFGGFLALLSKLLRGGRAVMAIVGVTPEREAEALLLVAVFTTGDASRPAGACPRCRSVPLGGLRGVGVTVPFIFEFRAFS